jgi:hypothetical protein
MLLLRNNYFAWLWEAKVQYKNALRTDYDTAKDRSNMQEISDAVLHCQINLNVDEEDEENWSKILVKQETDPANYNLLLKANNAVLKRVRNSARTSDKYKAFKAELDRVWEEIHCVSADDAIPNCGELEDVVVAKRNKKRKGLKTFRDIPIQKMMRENSRVGPLVQKAT